MHYKWTKEEVQIIKGAWATDHGRHALQMIVERLCGLHSPSFSLDAATMAYREGRRSVSIDLAYAINTDLKHMNFEETNDRAGNRPITATERLARLSAEHATASVGNSARGKQRRRTK